MPFLPAILLLACTDGGDDSGPADTGTPPPPLPVPAWAWEHWVWEDESTQDSVLALLDGYAEHDIPVSAVIVDSPWATGYNTMAWDTTRFPDPDGLVAELEARGVRLMLWTVPGINTDVQPLYDTWAAQGWFMQADAGTGPAVVDWWKGEGSLVDYWNPDAVAAWHEMMQPVLDQGIHGWKCDGLDFSALLANYSPGAGREVTRNEYSAMYYRDFWDHTREVLDDERIVTARPVDNYGADVGGDAVAFAPVDLGLAGWVGDQDGTWGGIQAVLRNFYWSAEYGYLAFGSDIGGYRDMAEEPLGRSKEVFVRWAQMGAFSPVMENGGGGEHRPWMWGEDVAAQYRALVQVHHAMIPVLRRQGARAYAEGRSLMTFLDRTPVTYLLGDDVLVVPIVDETQTVQVEFPAGDDWAWFMGDGTVYEGGTTTTMTLPLSRYPAFVRVGSEMAAALAGG